MVFSFNLKSRSSRRCGLHKCATFSGRAGQLHVEVKTLPPTGEGAGRADEGCACLGAVKRLTDFQVKF